MKLDKIASKAARDATKSLGAKLSPAELEKITSIIGNAMEKAVREASDSHTTACADCLSHDKDLAHKIQQQFELKINALIANLNSLR